VIKICGENVDQVIMGNGSAGKGEYVKLAIEDQGHGIEAAYRKKIFDPFFTTRQKGSGLGLTSADSIIRNHGGFLTVDSLPGSGTTFFVHLPRANENAPAVVHSEERVYFSGQSRILVMEDEQMVRTVLERMLDHCGCEADFAENGQEMIEAYGKAVEAGRPYDAVIIDLVIADGMGGKEAVGKLMGMYPDANAIVSSGYSDDLIMANFKNYGFKGALTKPYNIAELGQVLCEVLAHRTK
jgi:CheY-like chemotaxis protein